MKTRLLPAILAFAFPIASQAALHDRGGGLIYDDVLNVTWLQDASYARTSGFDADGYLQWEAAKSWAAGLAYFDSVRGVTLTGWRLPNIAPMGADWNYSQTYDGSSDTGANVTSPKSELAYMFHVNLGLKGLWTADGGWRPDFGVFGTGFDAPLPGEAKSNVTDVTAGGVTIRNLENYAYWYGVENDGNAGDPLFPQEYWVFYTWVGNQGADGDMGVPGGYALWAVRDGDVAAVPEPETSALLLAGLGLTGWLARRRSTAR